MFASATVAPKQAGVYHLYVW